MYLMLVTSKWNTGSDQWYLLFPNKKIKAQICFLVPWNVWFWFWTWLGNVELSNLSKNFFPEGLITLIVDKALQRYASVWTNVKPDKTGSSTLLSLDLPLTLSLALSVSLPITPHSIPPLSFSPYLSSLYLPPLSFSPSLSALKINV